MPWEFDKSYKYKVYNLMVVFINGKNKYFYVFLGLESKQREEKKNR